MASQIKRGVSLYSYQNETFQGKMSLEDCIRVSAELGAKGIEVIGEQSFWGWPEVGAAQADIDHWHALIKKYDCVPVSHDYMLDYKRYKGRLMPFEEQVVSIFAGTKGYLDDVDVKKVQIRTDIKQTMALEESTWKSMFVGNIGRTPTAATVMLRTVIEDPHAKNVGELLQAVVEIWESVLTRLRLVT
mgnify:CR=1 FL=1